MDCTNKSAFFANIYLVPSKLPCLIRKDLKVWFLLLFGIKQVWKEVLWGAKGVGSPI
jgi:hypothetical protein